MALLCLFLARSVRRAFMTDWAQAWGCLAVGLAALFAAFQFPLLAPWLEVLYCLGEYAFGFYLINGFHHYATGARVRMRATWMVPLAVLLAIGVSRLAEDFLVRFMVQAVILAGIFAIAFAQVERARRKRGTTPGIRLTTVALAVLVVNFLHYAPLSYYAAVSGITLPLAYSGYTSIYDLILEALLAFGQVTLVMEEAQRQTEASSELLQQAYERLERVARIDPLTGSLNRHAFYSLIEERRQAGAVPPRGCVAVLDIDGLKEINDSLGHAAGDQAICAVANATRSLVRAEDMVFRWGGDEFLVVLPGIDEDETRRRLSALVGLLGAVSLPGASTPSPVSVSVGIASFAAERTIEKAVDAADASMYAVKPKRY